MIREEIINEVSKRTRISKNLAGKVIDCIFECITEEIENGGTVKIRGFGKFDAYERVFMHDGKLKRGRIPRWRPSIKMKKRIGGNGKNIS